MNRIWFLLLSALLVRGSSHGGGDEGSREKLRAFLDYVQEVRSDVASCSEGTAETLDVKFSTEEWNSYAEIAVQTANMVGKLLRYSEESGNTLPLGTLYHLVRNNVQSHDKIFGSGLPLEDSVIPGYSQLCPYAYKEGGMVKVIDILYDYTTSTTEFYAVLASRQDWRDVHWITYSFNATRYRTMEPALATRVIQDPVARVEDGHWTKPYFDCSGGNVWMITYSAPILGTRDNAVHFRGVATVDIELTDIDINQCDPDYETGSGFSDQFRGTHQCPASTQCVHQPGSGMVAGSYLCVCRDGYYFPDPSASLKAFRGSILEADHEAAHQAACLKCPIGCDKCEDDMTCLLKSWPNGAQNASLSMCVLFFAMFHIFLKV